MSKSVAQDQELKKIVQIDEGKVRSHVDAPDLYLCELSNVVWKYYRSKAVSKVDCIAWVERALR